VELRHYRHVLALVEHANFRRASEALGVSQPALARSPFQIEREVGQRLFDRHGALGICGIDPDPRSADP
jgi:LysR family cyn operon transcriptional activator